MAEYVDKEIALMLHEPPKVKDIIKQIILMMLMDRDGMMRLMLLENCQKPM